MRLERGEKEKGKKSAGKKAETDVCPLYPEDCDGGLPSGTHRNPQTVDDFTLLTPVVSARLQANLQSASAAAETASETAAVPEPTAAAQRELKRGREAPGPKPVQTC